MNTDFLRFIPSTGIYPYFSDDNTQTRIILLQRHKSPRFESRIPQLTIKKIVSKDKTRTVNLKDSRCIDQLLSGPDVYQWRIGQVTQVGSSFIITLLINKPPIDLLSKRSDYVMEEELHR